MIDRIHGLCPVVMAWLGRAILCSVQQGKRRMAGHDGVPVLLRTPEALIMTATRPLA
jgi:hypothetical protein